MGQLDFHMGSSRIFISVILSGTSQLQSRSEVESKDPDEVSFAIPYQGILPRHLFWLKANSFGLKCMKENALKLHGKGGILGMLRLALLLAAPGRARRSA